MRGKYRNLLQLGAAWAVRARLRRRIENVVSWESTRALDPGCTAIIGMCHRLPRVLLANLRCLAQASWPALCRVVVVVDGPHGCVPQEVLDEALRLKVPFSLSISYYSPEQAALSEAIQLPYVYSWMSWCIGIAQCRTEALLIHDYDALVFQDALRSRYEAFVDSGVLVQGIKWYEGNGVRAEDRLATTFEAFVDTAWVRQVPPLALFNKIGYRRGFSVDFDTLLWLQDAKTPFHKRASVGMSDRTLVHPSQMIHQYTMFRRHPGKALPCFSMPMIPFFEWLSGRPEALRGASRRLEGASGRIVDLFGDGTRVNLSHLAKDQIDWALKQMVQASLHLDLPPSGDLYDYGKHLYDLARIPAADIWQGDFTDLQRAWIERARKSRESGSVLDSGVPSTRKPVDAHREGYGNP
jgi:hypothetical protein